MKSKKILALVMAGLMALSLTVPAFADTDPELGNTETDITGSYAPPVISVCVPVTSQAFINPLGLDVEVASGVTLSGRQIISAPMALKNQGATDLQVGATVSATVNEGSDMRFTTTTTGGKSGATKNVFAYLQAKQEKTLVGTEANNGGVEAADIATAYGNWDASDYNKDTDIVVNTAMPASKDNLVILRAATLSSGTFASYNEGSVALVRLAGDCTSSITTGTGWVETKTENNKTTGDGFTVNVAYTFKPAAIDKYAITVGDITYGGSFEDGTTAGAPAADSVKVTITSSAAKAAEGDTVTLTIAGVNGERVTPVVKAGTQTITVTPTSVDLLTGSLTKTITFTMPAGAVDITATVADVT